MDARLTTEQRDLRDSAAGLAAEFGPGSVHDLDDADRIARLEKAVAAVGWRTLRSDGASAVEVAIVAEEFGRGLVDDGRLARLRVTVRDRPGELARLTDRVARAGANVLEIGHRRAFADIRVGDVGIVMHLETRGRDHVREIVRLLEADGLTVEEEV